MNSNKTHQPLESQSDARLLLAQSAGVTVTELFHNPQLRSVHRRVENRLAIAVAGTAVVAAMWGAREAAAFASGALRACWAEARLALDPVQRRALDPVIESLISRLFPSTGRPFVLLPSSR